MQKSYNNLRMYHRSLWLLVASYVPLFRNSIMSPARYIPKFLCEQKPGPLRSSSRAEPTKGSTQIRSVI